MSTINQLSALWRHSECECPGPLQSCTVPFPQCQGHQQTSHFERRRQLDLRCIQTPPPISAQCLHRRVNPQPPSWKTTSDNCGAGELLLAIMDEENGSAREQAPQTPVLIYICGQVRLRCPSRELLTGIIHTPEILA